MAREGHLREHGCSHIGDSDCRCYQSDDCKTGFRAHPTSNPYRRLSKEVGVIKILERSPSCQKRGTVRCREPCAVPHVPALLCIARRSACHSVPPCRYAHGSTTEPALCILGASEGVKSGLPCMRTSEVLAFGAHGGGKNSPQSVRAVQWSQLFSIEGKVGSLRNKTVDLFLPLRFVRARNCFLGNPLDLDGMLSPYDDRDASPYDSHHFPVWAKQRGQRVSQPSVPGARQLR